MFEPINTAADINILWSGHRIISYSSAGNLDYNRSCSAGDTIFMLCKDVDLITLIHEMAHQFGAPDHYCEEGASGQECHFAGMCDAHPQEGIEQRPFWCIMDNDTSATGDIPWDDISERSLDEIFCQQCINDMIEYLTGGRE